MIVVAIDCSTIRTKLFLVDVETEIVLSGIVKLISFLKGFFFFLIFHPQFLS